MIIEEVRERRKEIGKELIRLYDGNCVNCSLVPYEDRYKTNPEVCMSCPIMTKYVNFGKELDKLVHKARAIKYGKNWRKIAPPTDGNWRFKNEDY